MPNHISDNHFSILKNSFLSSSEYKVSVNPFQDLVSTGVLLSWIPQEIQNTPL
jgi:hypothetical protein